MRRVVVLGGLGWFGAALVDRLRELDLAPLVAARRPGADLRVDAEKPDQIRAVLRPGDVVLDAAGPFQERTTALVEAAIDVGFDVVDLADGVAHPLRVRSLADRIERAGIRVLSACSSLSAVSAALVRRSGVAEPVRVTGFLLPATRDTARPGTARSLLHSVGAPIAVFREGRLASDVGWSERRAFDLPPPVGRIRGRLLESADAVMLPPVWPSLREVLFFGAAHVPGLDAVLALARRSRAVRGLVRACLRPALPVARLLGSRLGAFGVEVEDGAGAVRTLGLAAARGSHVVSVAPAALAARALADGTFAATGLVPADRQVDSEALWSFLNDRGVALGSCG